MKLIIKGEFTIETDSNIMNNVHQPLSLLEMEILPTNPVILNRFKSKLASDKEQK